MVFERQETETGRRGEADRAGARPERKKRFKIKIITRGAVIRLSVLAAALAVFILWADIMMIKMPGESYSGPLPELSDAEVRLRDELLSDVEKLAGEIGERNVGHYENLKAAADFIEGSLKEAGYEVRRQWYEVEGKRCSNIEVEIKGEEKGEEILVIGAHYDTVYGSPGANDNGTGVAALLALARGFAGRGAAGTVRFVFFVNEEPPFYFSRRMGSFIYAESCKQRADNIIGMISLETIGYYSDEPRSQKYPFPFGLVYPATGNFIGFVGNVSSRGFLHKVIGSFRQKCKFPSEGGAIPAIVPGISWSDHWSFWRCGYEGIMVTDTALFRYPYYHSALDTAEKIDYERLARVVSGLEKVIGEMAGLEEE